MNIVLIGYRGSGKSSVGRELAARLQRRFIDTDQLLVEQAGGQSIKDIFAAEGEAGFRLRETAAIQSVAYLPQLVLALGGGAVLRQENMEAVKRHGRVVWLRADPEALYARISADTGTQANRPNLTASGGLEEVRTLLAVRTPLYAAAADLTLDVGHLTIDEAVDALLTQLHLPV